MSEALLESVPEERGTTIGEAWGYLLSHPDLFIRQWNYKGAVMSGVIRAPFFFFTFLAGGEGWLVAIAAGTAQFAFRFVFAGIGGAFIQALRHVEPAWKALVSILVVIPLISHVFEYLVQLAFANVTQTGNLTFTAILRSLCVSVFSALFTLYIMRRDVLIVGEGDGDSLFKDFAKFPRLIFDFVAFVPNQLAEMVRRGAYLGALLGFAGFAVFSQLIVMAFYRPQLEWKVLYWTLDKGRIDIPVLRYYMVIATILMLMAVTASLVKGRVKRSRRTT
jgi:hypothetical protein